MYNLKIGIIVDVENLKLNGSLAKRVSVTRHIILYAVHMT